MPRIDKYLWAIRAFKTRSLATDAIKGGKIKFEKENVKPSKDVKVGDVYTIQIGMLQKTIRVTGLLEKRLSAKEAVAYYEDITPPEEYQKIALLKDFPFVQRDRGTGRPTKKERRELDDWFGDE
ncbi:MAG: RNA-binding S4 domain-containing protein [Flavobacteriales bacterium]